MMPVRPRSRDLDVAPVSRRYPDESDDYANELYVQDLIALSAVPARSCAGRRASVGIDNRWQFITHLVKWRIR